VILGTKGNVFGGFTPVGWDSVSYLKADQFSVLMIFRRRTANFLEIEHKLGELSCDER
jgi:hypothetical protein